MSIEYFIIGCLAGVIMGFMLRSISRRNSHE